jgi:hypothetical protein
MDLDWCSEESFNQAQLFNDSSVIKSKMNEKNSIKPKIIQSHTYSKNKKELDVNECFNLDLDTTDKIKVLEILNYLSFVSNNLRTIIRNKNLMSGFDQSNFDNLMKYLFWLRDACDKMKNYFVSSKKRDSLDNNFKPFKTSSYKFCNYSNSCSIHKNKTKLCDKNHFVFDMVLIDIHKLIESLEILTLDGLTHLNNIFSEKLIKITVNENSSCTIEKIEQNENVEFIEANNIFYINKNVIFKCFDVISFVLNKMYDESISFLNYDIESYQINLP